MASLQTAGTLGAFAWWKRIVRVAGSVAGLGSGGAVGRHGAPVLADDPIAADDRPVNIGEGDVYRWIEDAVAETPDAPYPQVATLMAYALGATPEEFERLYPRGRLTYERAKRAAMAHLAHQPGCGG